MFRLSSPAFADEQRIPHLYTCDGDDLPPPLTWSQPPATTAELVLVMEDPDSPTSIARVHWLCRGLPPRAGAVDAETPLVMGTNSFGERGYRGPCPPHGEGPHRFVFRLYALDTALTVLPDADLAEIVAAIHHHVIGMAELVGIYER